MKSAAAAVRSDPTLHPGAPALAEYLTRFTSLPDQIERVEALLEGVLQILHKVDLREFRAEGAPRSLRLEPQPPAEKFLSLRKCVELSGYCRKTLKKAIDRKELDASKPNRDWRVEAGELQRWMKGKAKNEPADRPDMDVRHYLSAVARKVQGNG